MNYVLVDKNAPIGSFFPDLDITCNCNFEHHLSMLTIINKLLMSKWIEVHIELHSRVLPTI